MANGWSLIIGLAFIVVFCGISWVASPKGDTQTIWRSTLILSAWSCYIMWAITLLAQWHPLIDPQRTGMRPQNSHHQVPAPGKGDSAAFF